MSSTAILDATKALLDSLSDDARETALETLVDYYLSPLTPPVEITPPGGAGLECGRDGFRGGRESLCGGRVLPADAFRLTKSGRGGATKPYRLCLECEKRHDAAVNEGAREIGARWRGLDHDERKAVFRLTQKGTPEADAVVAVLRKRQPV